MIPFIRNSFNFVINAMKNKLILLITILVFISGILVAQDYTTLKTASKKTLQAYNVATKQIMLDNYSQAILSMEALTSKEPRFIDGWLLLGELYKEAGNYDMAKQSLEKVAEIDATYSSKGYFFWHKSAGNSTALRIVSKPVNNIYHLQIFPNNEKRKLSN